jgi:hypothetical protein
MISSAARGWSITSAISEGRHYHAAAGSLSQPGDPAARLFGLRNGRSFPQRPPHIYTGMLPGTTRKLTSLHFQTPVET